MKAFAERISFRLFDVSSDKVGRGLVVQCNILKRYVGISDRFKSIGRWYCEFTTLKEW